MCYKKKTIKTKLISKDIRHTFVYMQVRVCLESGTIHTAIATKRKTNKNKEKFYNVYFCTFSHNNYTHTQTIKQCTLEISNLI